MIEVLKQALEALETPKPLDDYPPILNAYAKTINNAITAIKEAIREHAMYEVQRLGQEIEQEPVLTIEELEQEIYQNTRNFVSLDVMEWMLKRYYTHPPQRTEQNFCPRCGKRTNDIHTCTPPQRTEKEPVQVSPLEFVEMVMEKEHLIGKPIFWAEWPNKEKNNG